MERSLLAVRSLTGPGGAPSGAGTTSLPRRTGSERSTDDRWVRFRDVAAAVSTWAATGFPEDAEAAESWLATGRAGTPLPLAGCPGRRRPARSRSSKFWAWRAGGGPARGGGPTVAVIDLDLYGDVVGAYGASTGGPAGARTGVATPGPLSAAWPALAGAVDWVADHWGEPDAGVWESPGRRARLVASRVQAWFALDRMARWAERPTRWTSRRPAWHQEARRVLAWLEADGLAPGDRRGAGGLRREAPPRGGRPRRRPGAGRLARALARPHPIVAATVDRVLEQLGAGHLVYRYPPQVDDGRAGPDNPDLLASLWAVRALAELGRWEEAHDADGGGSDRRR